MSTASREAARTGRQAVKCWQQAKQTSHQHRHSSRRQGGACLCGLSGRDQARSVPKLAGQDVSIRSDCVTARRGVILHHQAEDACRRAVPAANEMLSAGQEILNVLPRSSSNPVPFLTTLESWGRTDRKGSCMSDFFFCSEQKCPWRGRAARVWASAASGGIRGCVFSTVSTGHRQQEVGCWGRLGGITRYSSAVIPPRKTSLSDSGDPRVKPLDRVPIFPDRSRLCENTGV